MKYRKLDSNGDYIFGQVAQNFYYDLDAVTQAINTRLKLLTAEWWEDITDGLPLFDKILTQRATPQGLKTVDMLIGERILGTLAVTGIRSVNSSFNKVSRLYSYSAEVSTIYGTINITEVLI